MSARNGGRDFKKILIDQLEPPPGDQLFECYHCWYKTKNKLSLEDHMRTHLIERPFACDKCDFRAIQKNHLLQHMKVHVLNVFGCSLCDFKSYDRSSVKRHLNVHNKSSTLQCRLCDFRTTRHSYLAKHMEGHGKDLERTLPVCCCSNCDFKSTSRMDLKMHMANHSGEKPFTCSHCDFKAISKSRIKQHMTYHNGEKPFACEHCDYRTNDRSSLRTHLTIHTREKSLKCTYCDYGSNDRDCLRAHIATHTGEKSFPCDSCAFRTTCRNNLRKHKKLKHDYKTYTCEECDFTTGSEPAFKTHKRMHSGENPYGCNQCDYTSYSKANVVSHQKIHGEKTITCTYCPYSARKNSDMKRHMKVHSMEKKRFKCKECNYRTADKKSFKNHKRVHTGQKPFACTVCDKTYNRKPALLDHAVKVHARKVEEEGNYVCNFCDYNVEIYTSKTGVHMAQHVLGSHTARDVPPAPVDIPQPVSIVETVLPTEDHHESTPFTCTVCHTAYDGSPPLNDHVVNEHARYVEEEGLYLCNLCDFNVEIFSSKTPLEMAQHILSSHTAQCALHATQLIENAQPIDPSAPILLGNVDYVCNICEHKSNNVSDMAKHMLAVHSSTEATATMVVPIDSPMLRPFLTDVPGTQFDAL